MYHLMYSVVFLGSTKLDERQYITSIFQISLVFKL